MNARWRRLLVLAALPWAAAAARPAIGDGAEATLWRSRGGETTWWLNRDVLRPLGIALQDSAGRTDRTKDFGNYLEMHFAATDDSGFALRLRGAALVRLDASALRHRGGPVFALPQGKLDLRGFRLQQRRGGAFGLDVADAQGKVWFNLDHAHQYVDAAAGRFAVRHMDLRLAPALAQRLGHPEFAGLLVGGMQSQAAGLSADGAVRAGGAAAGGGADLCSAPWPAPRHDEAPWADMRMIHLAVNWEERQPDGVNAYRCGRDDDAGGHSLPCTADSSDGLVVISPDASLRNDGTAAIAWHPKFTAPAPPYGNDQHPFLVWNLYRVDADGSLAQIGVSALKHAFHTINAACGCAQGEVLYPTCEDTYGGFSNDYPAALGPRAEVIAATAQWGRCGSLYDKDCDGQADADRGAVADEAYSPSKHMAVREAELSPVLHPGARWFLEYWYVVRDDIDPWNNLGLLEVLPRKQPGQGSDPNAWIWRFDTADFRNGPMVDLWRSQAADGAYTRQGDAASAQGRVRVTTRVQRAGDGRWRYDWAVFNLDYARVRSSGSEPNLRVLENRGLVRFEVPMWDAAALQSARFAGIGGERGASWGWQRDAQRIAWVAPADNPLDWGRSNIYTLVTDAAPVAGVVLLGDAVADVALRVDSLVPLDVAAPRRRSGTLQPLPSR